MSHKESNQNELTNTDQFTQYLGNLVLVAIEGSSRMIAGRLINLSDGFLTLEKRDGRRALIRRKSIVAVEPMKDREAV